MGKQKVEFSIPKLSVQTRLKKDKDKDTKKKKVWFETRPHTNETLVVGHRGYIATLVRGVAAALRTRS